MYDHRRVVASVHGDKADLADIGQREYVRDRFRIEPHGSEVWKIPNKTRILVAAVRDHAEGMGARPDVR